MFILIELNDMSDGTKGRGNSFVIPTEVSVADAIMMVEGGKALIEGYSAGVVPEELVDQL
jgi:hypothetical protein